MNELLLKYWWAASLAANLAITAIEYLNRWGGFSSFGRALLATWPLIVVSQAGLYYAWRGAPSLMLAWSWFFVCGFSLRLMSSNLLAGEPLSPQAWAGVLAIFAGAVLVKLG